MTNDKQDINQEEFEATINAMSFEEAPEMTEKEKEVFESISPNCEISEGMIKPNTATVNRLVKKGYIKKYVNENGIKVYFKKKTQTDEAFDKLEKLFSPNIVSDIPKNTNIEKINFSIGTKETGETYKDLAREKYTHYYRRGVV